jgi:hypothetical protein
MGGASSALLSNGASAVSLEANGNGATGSPLHLARLPVDGSSARPVFREGGDGTTRGRRIALVQRTSVAPGARTPARAASPGLFPSLLPHAPSASGGGSGTTSIPALSQASGAGPLRVQREAAPAPAPTVAAEVAMPSASAEPEAEGPDVARIAGQVYELLVERLSAERKQRGI